jgi:N-6 DNA Methylase
MVTDSIAYQHKEWLGLLQPVGLVVSPLALERAGAIIDRSKLIEIQAQLREIDNRLDTDAPFSVEFSQLVREILGWEATDLGSPEGIEIVLTDYGETLAPDFVVVDPDTKERILLIKLVATGQDLDKYDTQHKQGWQATIEEKFERLLRETEIPTGILWNGTQLRLVYAPRGESSGHLTFPLAAMTEVAGRSILGGLVELLNANRLFNVPLHYRLPKLLAESRNYQAEVSNQLAEQVLEALWELLRGFGLADEATERKLLATTAATDIYGGLITTLMRLVFVLYAEDRGLMPGDTVYQRNYAVSGLYEQLRDDLSNYPDTMEQRYGAWAWLLSLFRLVYEGGGATSAYLPARHGQLFDPREYPFLEGAGFDSAHPAGSEVPRIPDGVIYRVLDKLLMLNGEKLSYRTLDVEQIGSVYEGIMGFTVERSSQPSIGVKSGGAKKTVTVVVDVAELLATKPADRSKKLNDWASCKLASDGSTLLKQATTIQEIVDALSKKRSPQTPDILPQGALYLQPTAERRRSGSHYTPRALTQPIVAKTLEPIFQQLGDKPTPEQILDLKICDPAMGSGAFLVEACRQLADKLVAAWEREKPPHPPAPSPTAGEGEISRAVSEVEPLLIARRLVAQRCLYGVDKNPFAVNLAKLSLWLATLAQDLPFTFLDHALKCGDSLVGLRKADIGSFSHDPLTDLPLMSLLQKNLDEARAYRYTIQSEDSRTDEDDVRKRQALDEVEKTLDRSRLIADVAIMASYEGGSKTELKQRREGYSALVRQWQLNPQAEEVGIISRCLREEIRVKPFNWEIEFPEVFDRENGGFDSIVGNPPFVGGKKISTNYGQEYFAWIKEHNPESSSADLVAFFFRQAFNLLRKNGTLGLIATNTISQGGTRYSGLRWICTNDGAIYHAQKRLKWPGLAAVVVSLVHIIKGNYHEQKILDNKPVDFISAFLFTSGGHEDPGKLKISKDKSFIGTYILGMGFTFDDNKPEETTSIAEMYNLIAKDPRNQELIFPYIGGEEVNSNPTHSHHRYIINFSEMSENEAKQWPDLMKILEEKVKPQRDEIIKRGKQIHEYDYWKFWDKRTENYKAIESLDRVLVISLHSPYMMFAFLPSSSVFSHALAVFALDTYSSFTTIQSSIHETWARFFGSSMKDDLRYTPSDCFETFPFPPNWETNPELETIGKTYYEYRAQLMVQNNQGLTDTYNRFHNPDEDNPDILKLRQLHAEMDKAVLAAYRWEDINPTCEFLLDYEEEESIEESTRSRKKPYRYRWTEDTHDEVLTRLLALNKERAQAEEMLGGEKAVGKKAEAKKTKKKAASKSDKPQAIISSKQLSLIPPDAEQLEL